MDLENEYEENIASKYKCNLNIFLFPFCDVTNDNTATIDRESNYYLCIVSRLSIMQASRPVIFITRIVVIFD